MGCDKPLSGNDQIIVSPNPDEVNPQHERIVGQFCNEREAQNGQISQDTLNKITYPLSDRSHPAHKAFSESVLRNVAGNGSIGEFYEKSLPNALATVARQTPDITGLVTPSRGQGASSLQKNLAHSTRGDAFAFELTGTAELVRRNNADLGPLKPSNGGRSLKIGSLDRVDLGVKLQADYHSNQLNRPRGTGKYQKFRQTIEADTLVSRQDKTIPPTAIDFKHVRHDGICRDRDSRDPCNKQPFRSQLDGIENAIRTGDIADFHFVTNGTFDEGMKSAIAEVNNRLDASDLAEKSDESFISIHERCQFQG